MHQITDIEIYRKSSDSESSTVEQFKALTLDSHRTLPEINRTVQSIESPIREAPYPVQSSFVPHLEDRRRIQKSNIRKSQAAIVSEDVDSTRAPVDNDISMTDTCEATDLHEIVGEGAGTASDDDSMSDDEDISTIAGAHRGRGEWILVPDVESHSTQRVAKLPTNNSQVPSSRQTRSATKQKDILSSRTPMKIGKHSSKKDKP